MIALVAIVPLVLAGGSPSRCAARNGGAADAALGSSDPFKPPDSKATELNAAGKVLYRQGKWDEARAQYRAALAADPSFLAPRLNVACSFVRQERFAEATAEVRALLERAYVPWAREVLEAADLGALKARPEMGEIRRALADTAAKWGQGLDESLLFVGRQKPPLRVPEKGEGVFILNPHQELYAYAPATGQYRQLTADDGRVLLVARSPDRRRAVYVTAEKLFRGRRSDDIALRGVVLGELTLASMAVAPPLRIEGDVRRIEVVTTARGLAFRIDGTERSGLFARDSADVLLQLPAKLRASKPLAVLTPAGAAVAPPQALAGSCRGTARDTTAAGIPVVTVALQGAAPRSVGSQFGAGLTGLPLH